MGEIWFLKMYSEYNIMQILTNVHSPEECAGDICTFHNPSDHHMRKWTLLWRDSDKLLERVCPHQRSHPDPDDRAYHESMGHKLRHHACDGCCVPPERRALEYWEAVFQEDWESQLWEWGYAELGEQDHGTWQINVICESRWEDGDAQSRLWDQPSQIRGHLVDKKARAQIRRQMPFLLADWRRRRAEKQKRSS